MIRSISNIINLNTIRNLSTNAYCSNYAIIKNNKQQTYDIMTKLHPVRIDTGTIIETEKSLDEMMTDTIVETEKFVHKHFNKDRPLTGTIRTYYEHDSTSNVWNRKKQLVLDHNNYDYNIGDNHYDYDTSEAGVCTLFKQHLHDINNFVVPSIQTFCMKYAVSGYYNDPYYNEEILEARNTYAELYTMFEDAVDAGTDIMLTYDVDITKMEYKHNAFHDTIVNDMTNVIFETAYEDLVCNTKHSLHITPTNYAYQIINEISKRISANVFDLILDEYDNKVTKHDVTTKIMNGTIVNQTRYEVNLFSTKFYITYI